MKHIISKIGLTLGILVIISSVIRWFFIYYDPSQMILGVVIGIIVCGFAYMNDWMKNQEEEMSKTSKRLDAFTKWLGKQEME